MFPWGSALNPTLALPADPSRWSLPCFLPSLFFLILSHSLALTFSLPCPPSPLHFSLPSFPSFSSLLTTSIHTSLSFTYFGCSLWRLPFLLHPVVGIYEGYCVWSQCLHFSLLCVVLLWELHHNSPSHFSSVGRLGSFQMPVFLCLRTGFVKSSCIYPESEEHSCSVPLSQCPPGHG